MNKNRLFNRRKKHDLPIRCVKKSMRDLNSSLRKLGFKFVSQYKNEEYD